MDICTFCFEFSASKKVAISFFDESFKLAKSVVEIEDISKYDEVLHLAIVGQVF